MRIPKKFKLGAVQWSVDMVDDLPNSMGSCNNELGKILVKDMENTSVINQTFCHELVHCILYSMGRNEHDEVFVDNFASFLHQYLDQVDKS